MPESRTYYVMERKSLVYALIDPRTSRTRYVGITYGTLRCRLRDHIRTAERGTAYAVCNWIRALAKLGLSPTIVLLEETTDRNRECDWIAFYRAKGPGLLNGTDGGEGAPGRRYSPEQRQVLSQQRKGKPGHPHSAETRAKISAVQKGKTRGPKSEELKQKIREALTGRKRPPEVVAKMSASKKGKPTGRYNPMSPEGMARMIAAKTGKPQPYSATRGPAISAAKKGKTHKSQGPLSEATKARIRDANRAFPAAAKLSHDDVRAIRARWAAGGIMQKELAAEFGVRPPTISAIIQRRIWGYVV